jgi:hypothetical protein
MKKNINKEKYKKVGTTVGGLLLILILLLFGISYAWYSFTNPDIDVSGTTSSWCSGLDVKVTEGSTISNYLGNAPVSNYSEAGYSSSFTITNNESSEVKVDLSLIDINIDKELISNDFRYTIVKDSTVISEGNFSQVKSGSGSSLTLASEITIPKNSTNTYSLVLWIYETGSTQSEMMNKSLSGKIKVSISSSFCSGSTGNLGSLYLAIKNQAVADNVASTYVTSSSGISFSSISSDTNGKGVYMLSSTASDTYPIYYYRGAVTNNNVIFGGFCWKIVRTTETGGVKLIYNGSPTSDNQCTNTTGTSTQIGTSYFNSSNTSPAYVGYMYGTVYTRSTKSLSSNTTEYNYGNSVTYSGGTYTLTDTISSSSWSSIYNRGLNSNHYTCFTTGTTCTNVYYIYYTTSSIAYYITLKNGKTVEDALSEMLDYNTTSSTIKGSSTSSGSIDYWYYNNLISYASQLEDTVFCNDRSIYKLNGWNPDGGSTTDYLRFGTYGRLYANKAPSLTCSRDIDKFTVSTSNGNGALTYPVGLLTGDEIALAGGVYGTSNSTYYLYTNQDWWAGSPYSFDYSYANEFYAGSTGGALNGNLVTGAFGARPVVSLSLGVEIVSGGDGTSTNPYVVSQD